MEKKYIVELYDENVKSVDGYNWLKLLISVADKPVMVETAIELLPYTEPDMEKVEDEAYKRGREDAIDAISSKEQSIADKAYQSGLSDAWEAARKIVCLISDGGFTQDLLDSIFGSHNHQSIMAQYSASDAIEKISKYEPPEQTQIGDEVEGDFGIGMVTKPLEGGAYIMWKDGSSGSYTADKFKLTGRHSPELVEVLQKMEEK